MTITHTQTQPVIVVGVDTHQRTHHAVVLDAAGARLADREFPADTAGHRGMLDWAAGHGLIDRFGVESTGSYGAGLTRQLLAAGVEVVEVNRPDKTVRSRDGKSDPIDAEAAARAVLSGRATARPKVTTGVIESIRMLLVTYNSAVKARTAAYEQMRDIITTAPASLRDTMIGLTGEQRAKKAAVFRPDMTRLPDPEQAAKLALRTLAHRIQDLTAEADAAEKVLDKLVKDTVPTLVSHWRIGTLIAAQLAVTAGQNMNRMRSEAAFAKLTGTAPIPASSGKTRRMRLSRGGDRQANKALHLTAIGRLKDHPETRAYRDRRLAEGLSPKDITRCLKRAIAREAYNALKTDLLNT
ncbi:IS110 family transposase [Microbacterium aerolatum]|uniref:IS110 family transposase n=1 Tax=Microbacterium aerolatum TaxID=153731 RepID=UPI002001563A|nr:IS110 family transposase [Microbacterium aerolatum]MCK3769363.1 IS110 family transposase [Microbacterium aerolatum]